MGNIVLFCFLKQKYFYLDIINQENIQEITNNEQYKQTLQELLRQINEASLSTHN